MSLPTADDFTATTTLARRKRHWSATRELRRFSSAWPGRSGSTLCDGYAGGAMDQERVDAEMPRKRTVIADLPPCKQCDKSRNRRIEGRPS